MYCAGVVIRHATVATAPNPPSVVTIRLQEPVVEFCRWAADALTRKCACRRCDDDDGEGEGGGDVSARWSQDEGSTSPNCYISSQYSRFSQNSQKVSNHMIMKRHT